MMGFLGFFKLLSPSMWVIAALTLALGFQTMRVSWANSKLDTIRVQVAECRANVKLQNINIEAFRMESYLMGQSLKRIKAEALKLREAAKVNRRKIVDKPIASTCQEAIAVVTRDAQGRYLE